MTEIRHMREDEREQLAALYNNAYRTGMSVARGWVEGAAPEQTICVSEKGRLASVVRMIPYAMRIGGRDLPMGGIGGVATWADCQGKGYAGDLMKRSVTLMREHGFLVSALYPFSHRYYRKFGWETVGDRAHYRDLHPRDFRPAGEAAMVRAFRGPQDIALLSAAYDAMRARFNGLVERDRANWERRLKALEEARMQAYLILRGDEPSGYFLCDHHRTEDGWNEQRIQDFACIGPDAFRALGGFLATMPTNVHAISIVAPAFPQLHPLLLEPAPSVTVTPGWQFRVLDVGRATAARGYSPMARGSFTARITDDHGPWNNGVWQFDFGEGAGTARPSEAAAPDFDWTIQQFSQLFIGHADPVALARQGMFPAPTIGKANAVRDAFFDAPPHLMDFF